MYLKKIDAMHATYGTFSGVKCRTCPHLDAHSNGDCTRVWYKCKMYGDSCGPGTDWRVGYDACGAFTIPPEQARSEQLYGAVYKQCKGIRQREPELEGQIAMVF